MASNVSSEKLLFYAAAGALGGFAAWGLAEPILGIRWVYGRDILFGALIGALISAFLASIETLSVGQWRQAARRFVVGGMIAHRASIPILQLLDSYLNATPARVMLFGQCHHKQYGE